MLSAVTLLPDPDSPTKAKNLAFFDVKAHTIDSFCRARLGMEVGLEIANL
jgi:hypothetical protein